MAVGLALLLAAGLSSCVAAVDGSGSPALAPPAQLTVVGDSGAAFDQQVKNALSDVEAFWRVTYPQIEHGAALPPLRGELYSVDGSTVLAHGAAPADIAAEACVHRKPDFIVDNAAYCRLDDSIIWDRAPSHLVPVLAARYGPTVTALVFAHEFGHAVQTRTGAIHRTDRTIDLESQADCAAGAFIAWAAAGNAPHFRPSAADLDRSLNGYLEIRDSTPDSPAGISHGNGFDRINAVQQGISRGAGYCFGSSFFSDRAFTERGYVTDALGAADRARNGNEPLAEVLRANGLAKDLNRFWRLAAVRAGRSFAAVHLARAADPPCAAAPIEFGYCPSDNTVYYSSHFAEQAYFSGNVLVIDPHTGAVGVRTRQPADFALGMLMSIAWGLAARHQLFGGSLGDRGGLLAAICYAGSYADDINLDTTSPAHPFVLSPPDMDEATAAVLNLVPAPASFGSRATDGLQRVQAFVRGYSDGLAGC